MHASQYCPFYLTLSLLSSYICFNSAQNRKSSWLSAGVCASDVEEHLSVGMTLLAKGQYSDALSHFHAAIDADPTNYMSYYKRATVFLALSRSRPALADLDKVLQLKSDFIQVRSISLGVHLIFPTLQIRRLCNSLPYGAGQTKRKSAT